MSTAHSPAAGAIGAAHGEEPDLVGGIERIVGEYVFQGAAEDHPLATVDGAMLQQVVRQGPSGVEVFSGDPEGGAQVGIEIGIDGEHLMTVGGEYPGQGAGDGRLARSALSGDADLHDGKAYQWVTRDDLPEVGAADTYVSPREAVDWACRSAGGLIMRRELVVAVAVLLIAAACAEDEGGGGGTLAVAITSDPGHLNPAITTSGAVHTASELMYNGLLARDERGAPLPELAERWDIEDDGALYRFHLRDDVEWHDGEPFTSADVKFTFEQVLLEFHARTKASLAPALQSIETPDEETVVFRFAQPYAPLLQQLDATEAPILPEHLYEGTDPLENPVNTAPVGTGPFRFVSYSPGSEIELEGNPNYFKDGSPRLDRVVMRIIPDSASQIAALESGEVDFVWNVPGPDLERLREDPDVELAQTTFNPGGANCVMTIAFNLNRPTLQQLEVRRAIAHAIERQPYLDQILFGAGAVAEAPISSGIPWAHPEGLAMPEFDPDEAARLLDGAGWVLEGGDTRVARSVPGVEDGSPLELDFLVFPSFARYGELLRDQLRVVGVDLNVRPLEPAVFAPTVFQDRDFDTNVMSYCNGPDPEIGVRRMYHSSQIGTAPFTNAAHYSNPAVDELFDRAGATVDTDDRSELYRQIQEILVDELPYYWLVETRSTRAWASNCTGFKPWTGLFAEAASCAE